MARKATRGIGLALGGIVVMLSMGAVVSAQGEGNADVETRLERGIRFWQARIDRNPDAYLEQTLLGEALIEKARRENAVERYAAAEDALRRALSVNPSYLRAHLALAFIHVQRHQFESALARLTPIVAAGGGGLQARAYLVDVYLAMGRYEDARELLRVEETPPSAALMSRRAGLAGLEGDIDRALTMMSVARDVSDRAADPPSVRAFYEFQTGELHLHRGRLNEAERHYRAAMALAPGDAMPWLGLGEVAVARGQQAEALEWLRRAETAARDPEVLAILGDVHLAAGDLAVAAEYYHRVVAVCTADEESQRMYRTFLASFYADRNWRLDEAVTLALAELDRRQDVETLETAAWALFKIGDPQRALALIGKAREVGTRDAELLYRAGQIARAVGRPDDARALLAESKVVNPHYAPPVSGP